MMDIISTTLTELGTHRPDAEHTTNLSLIAAFTLLYTVAYILHSRLFLTYLSTLEMQQSCHSYLDIG